jgi:hypothetical protein
MSPDAPVFFHICKHRLSSCCNCAKCIMVLCRIHCAICFIASCCNT